MQVQIKAERAPAVQRALQKLGTEWVLHKHSTFDHRKLMRGTSGTLDRVIAEAKARGVLL